MVTKADLMFVREFEYRQRERERTLEKLREKVDVHSIQYDKIMVGGGEQRDRLAEHAASVDAMEKRFAKETLEDKARYLRVVDEVMHLPTREMEVIRLRYIEDHSWNWIRRTLHYERSHVFKIHANALRLLEQSTETD